MKHEVRGFKGLRKESDVVGERQISDESARMAAGAPLAHTVADQGSLYDAVETNTNR